MISSNEKERNLSGDNIHSQKIYEYSNNSKRIRVWVLEKTTLCIEFLACSSSFGRYIWIHAYSYREKVANLNSPIVEIIRSVLNLLYEEKATTSLLIISINNETAVLPSNGAIDLI
jgi:hypothetical protein